MQDEIPIELEKIRLKKQIIQEQMTLFWQFSEKALKMHHDTNVPRPRAMPNSLITFQLDFLKKLAEILKSI